MFCPKCKAEYREGFFICADCKVDLVSELPPEPEDSPGYPEYVNLVNIERYPSRHEAELAKGALSINGIDAFVQGGGKNGWNAPLESGVQLLVQEKDVEEAKDILSETIRKAGLP